MTSKNNEPKKHPNTIREEVLAKIDSKELRMRSRTFFMLQIVGTIVLAIAVFALTVLIGNFVSFTLRLNGHDVLLSCGWHCALLFFQVFPWWLVLLDVMLIFLLQRLIRPFRFAYRNPVLYSFLALVLLVSVLGALLDTDTPFNDQLLHQADQNHLPPPLDALYKGSRQPPPPGSGLYTGVIRAVTPTTALITDPDNDTPPLTILLPTHGPASQLHVTVGEPVVIFGNQISSSTVQAMDIHPLDPNDFPPDTDGH